VSKDKEEENEVIHVYVPCCGPGQELIPVANTIENVLGEKKKGKATKIQVLGLDLSPGMVEVARRRIEAASEDTKQEQDKKTTIINLDKEITAVVGDAALPPSSNNHIVFSCFGLQQLPDPLSTLQVWIQSLRVGGVAVVLYWPPKVEEDNGPWSRWSQLVKAKLLQEKKDAENEKKLTTVAAAANPPPSNKEESNKSVSTDFDVQITKFLKEQQQDETKSTISILQNCYKSHEMKWKNIDEFWTSMTHYGPWKSLRLKRGDDFVDGLRDEFINVMKKGGKDDDDDEMSHLPKARLLVLVKTREGNDGNDDCNSSKL